MIRPRVWIAALVLLPLGAGIGRGDSGPDSVLHRRAARLADSLFLVDTHIDLPLRLLQRWSDISVRTADGDFDYVRARAGGLDLPFMSIYVSATLEGTGKAKPRAETLIGIVRRIASTWPEKFALVTSVREVREKQKAGVILLAMGMENGSPIEGDLANLEYFHRLGIRYITLAHSKSNHLSDASYDNKRRWNGLSPFGRAVVVEMNRLGIMVDVSHLSDSAFFQVLRTSRAPVIASHSSCRHFTPGFERNMSDGMIRALALRGGVIQINFGSEFIDDSIRRREEKGSQEIKAHVQHEHWDPDGVSAEAYTKQYWKKHPRRRATVAEVAAHLDHVVKLVGVDYVGFGSDFEGVGDSLPVGLKDVSAYPNLIGELLKLGYTEAEIGKICGGNLLRVWSAVERIAVEGSGQ